MVVVWLRMSEGNTQPPGQLIVVRTVQTALGAPSGIIGPPGKNTLIRMVSAEVRPAEGYWGGPAGMSRSGGARRVPLSSNRVRRETVSYTSTEAVTWSQFLLGGPSGINCGRARTGNAPAYSSAPLWPGLSVMVEGPASVHSKQGPVVG